MSLWERDYMHERWRRMHAEYRPSECGELSPRLRRRTTKQSDPPWLRIIVWLCIAAALTAWGVREYERRHPKPAKRVIRSPEVAEPKQEDEQPAKPFDFFRQAPR